MNDLILYTTEDGRSQIKLRTEDQTVWLTQLEMAELFDATKQNISLHLKNLFEDGELIREASAEESSVVQTEGGREVQRTLTLSEDEIDTLNRLVVIFLETAELRAKNRQQTPMSLWKGSVDQIITSNGFRLLTHAGSISHEEMERQTNARYIDYDQRRKQQEALAADQQDEAELKALENQIKHRPKK